jgi:hypothetical protein
MAIEDGIRNSKATTAENQKLVNDLTNKAITAGKVTLIEGIVNGLPAPVNFAARALGEGLHAAFKVQPDAILQPADGNQDPRKLMAYAMAFAIIKAIWCFIKSILNPLPIIGSFFSLCIEEALSEINRADVAASNNDNSNQALASAVNSYNNFRDQNIEVVPNSDLERARQNLRNSSQNDSRSTEMTSGPAGITFDQFVASTATAAPSGTSTDSDAVTSLQSQINQGTTSANVPPASPQIESPEWRPSEVSRYQEARKLFGL